MPATTTKPAKKSPTLELECGEDAFVVYWQPFPLPDDAGNGTWNTLPVRVVGCGKLVCFETPNVGLAFGEPVTPNSPLRWSPPDRVFRTHDEAEALARSLPRPA